MHTLPHIMYTSRRNKQSKESTNNIDLRATEYSNEGCVHWCCVVIAFSVSERACKRKARVSSISSGLRRETRMRTYIQTYTNQTYQHIIAATVKWVALSFEFAL